MKKTVIFITLLLVTTTAHASDMYDRVCPRVLNRFSSDQKMWDRVNDRIQNRFNFLCSKQASNVQHSDTRSSFATYSKGKEARDCTSKDWYCAPYSDCTNGLQTRNCNLVNYSCSNPNQAKPSESEICELISDPHYEELNSLYTKRNKLLEEAKYLRDNAFDTSVRLKLVDVYSELETLNKGLLVIVNRARERNLTIDELALAMAINDKFDLRAEYFILINKQDRLPSLNVYVKPSYSNNNSYSGGSSETHSQMCNRLQTQAALNGSAYSGSFGRQMYELGCSSKEQYCAGYILSGGLGTPNECQ